MKRWAILLVSIALGACANSPSVPTASLFDDAQFGPPTKRVSAEDVFTFTPEMRRYLDTEIVARYRDKGPVQSLFDALYAKGELRLEYESDVTRTAAQTFAARTGNCLSLVIMTAAFAKAMDLAVTYQQVYVDDTWGRTGDVYLSIGHVNLTLSSRPHSTGPLSIETDRWTIDFLPPADIRGVRSRAISERTVLAMYLNNRAVEALAQGRIDDAYWRARAAIEEDADFIGAYNTLGAIYRRHGNAAQAERALTYALERDPWNPRVMSNLVGVLEDEGRDAAAAELARKLGQLEPNPPFAFFNRGIAAMRSGNYETARDMFAKEVDRAPYFHEFHFWLGAAYAGLGEFDQAREQMAIALKSSTKRNDRELYASKLDHLRSLTVR